jgi:hypothetical protein
MDSEINVYNLGAKYNFISELSIIRVIATSRKNVLRCGFVKSPENRGVLVSRSDVANRASTPFAIVLRPVNIGNVYDLSPRRDKAT